MKKIKTYFIWHKKNVYSAMALVLAAFAAFVVFYIFKNKYEYYVSSKDKLLLLICTGISAALLLFKIKKTPKALSIVLDLILLGGTSYFLFYKLQPLISATELCALEAPFYNIVFIYLILLFVYGIAANGGIAALLGGGLVYAYYIAGYFAYSFRGTPIVFSDILSAKTAFAVAGNYPYYLNDRIFTAFYEIMLLGAIGLFYGNNCKGVKERIVTGVFSLAVSVSLLTLLIRTDYLSKKGFSTTPFTPITCALENGLLLNGVMTAHMSLLDVPEGYSKERVDEIIEKYTGLKDSYEISDVKPNVIVIMNESFTDIDYLETVETTEESIPKFKAMSENCVKGTLISSILGGNTPNSEFECLTGCSLAFLPTNMVAFQQLLNKEVPSMATMIKNQGYSTTAVHLYDPTYFDRNRVYPLLGIDKFVSEKNYSTKVLPEVEYIRDEFAADWCTFKLIQNEFENKNPDEKFFCFSVTTQNHGGYWGGKDADIKVLNVTENVDYANEYVRLLKVTDDTFADFIEYFDNISEPTIVVMFGDHQPYLFADDYVPVWEGYDYTAEEKRYMQAKVPFVIYANYDIEEADMGEMSINYLGPTIMKTAGLPMSDYFAYLDNLRESVPVVSAVCFADRDGNHFYDYKESTYSELLTEYEYLQYNYLKGDSDADFYKE